MRNHSESILQQNCVKWFDMQYPKLKLNLFSIPNEGARTPQNGARMKAQGRRAGVADMFLAVSVDSEDILNLCSGSHGLFIEFKFGDGKQNENQKRFQYAVVNKNYTYFVVETFDQFVKLITEYLK